MSTETKHTPGLLQTKKSRWPKDGEYDYALIDATGHVIGEAFGRVGTHDLRPAQANAERLAMCWNTHDALIAVLDAAGAVLTDLCANGGQCDWTVVHPLSEAVKAARALTRDH